MTQANKYKLNIDSDKEIVLTLPSGVFAPTGTTESLISGVKSQITKPGKTLDLGCGSGVIGLALDKLGLVNRPLYLSDLSPAAVDCAKENALAHNCPVVAKIGRIFEPWKQETFDYIVNDISGVSQEIAKLSPWFDNVPCDSGADGTRLVIEVIQQAKDYLDPKGLLFFPIVSFSAVDKILTVAKDNFSNLKRVVNKEWPLPKEMYQHLDKLRQIKDKGYAQFTEKFGMVLWFTDVYVAYN